MQNVVIRPVQTEDLNELLGLMYQYIVDFYQRPRPSEEALQSLVAHLLNHPASGIQFVAELNGCLVGFATLYFSFSTLQVKRAAILNDLFVASEVRGQKVGEGLFQTCLSYIRENDFAYMTWETAKDNQVAQAMYDKLGGERSEWVVYEMS